MVCTTSNGMTLRPRTSVRTAMLARYAISSVICTTSAMPGDSWCSAPSARIVTPKTTRSAASATGQRTMSQSSE